MINEYLITIRILCVILTGLLTALNYSIDNNRTAIFAGFSCGFALSSLIAESVNG